MWDRAATEAIDRDGYVVVPDAIDPAWAARLARGFDGAAQDGGTQHVRDAPEMRDHAAWTALERHPLVVAAAAHVLASAYTVRDLHGRNPLPGYGLQGLHADWPERPPGSLYVIVTALWMIDDFTSDNGATRVVPGTHLTPRPIPKSVARPAAHHPAETIVTGRAGSVLFLNGHIWHSGTKNRSGGPRRAVQMVIQRASAAR